MAQAPGFELQNTPKRIYLTALPGIWLLSHSTPAWRLKDPEMGFQRIVKDERAQNIAATVLDQQRTFPNAIVLATDRDSFTTTNGTLNIPDSARFLVVDGQHRLRAQKFSTFHALYACVIHMGLNEVEMANLFLEINDNQKRVPASLRWDLVRLVRPDDDPSMVSTVDIIYELATNKTSPLFQRIDLTGEQKEISLKQASLAPEIKSLISSSTSGLKRLDFERQYDVIATYIAAIKELDAGGWRAATTPFYQARIVRVLLRLLPLIVKKIGSSPESISAATFKRRLNGIDRDSLAPERIRASQGSAGMKDIYEMVKAQLAL